MTPEPEIRNLSDAERLELLEHPELWPEDPRQQAELAALLELHLALQAHGPALEAALRPPRGFARLRGGWMPTAAAALMALVPTLYALNYARTQARQAKDRARIVAAAHRRGQERLWADFFQQSAELLKDFQENPRVCRDDLEDFTRERLTAEALLQASHQLAAQGSPVQGADAFRANFHAWLTEFTLEDGCMAPERVRELRELAQTHNLEDEAQRLSRRLRQGEGS